MKPRRVLSPPAAPIALFDGDCGFCRFWVERWRRQVREPFNFEPYQESGARFREIPPEDFARALQVVDRDGAVMEGADAVFRLLRSSRWGWLEWLAQTLPIFRWLAGMAYRVVASHRSIFSRLTRLGWGSDPAPATFAVARRVFAHGLGLIFFFAFGSLALQWRGLIGSGGIMPAGAWLEAARQQVGSEAYRLVPTVFWFGHSDGALLFAALAGVVLSLVLAGGLWPGPCTLALWALYLSFCSVSSPFLDFQWDTLLLETALLAAVFLPWRWSPRWETTTRLTTVGRWLLWWLLARLILESGAVKLSSGDPTWRNLTAMAFHYETQPLPLATAWLAHHSPLWVHRLEVLGTFAVEFTVPLLIFSPPRLRHAAAWAVIALQAAIMLTGNYAFFNLLTILLCVPLLEDRLWFPRLRRAALASPPVQVGGGGWGSHLVAALGLASAVLTAFPLALTLHRSGGFPAPVQSVLQAVQPLRSFNSYGLFAVMTTKRAEIAIEGSVDGIHWEEYAFKWKPGDLARRPQLVAPHQPRLDWQMWFAALSSYREQPWFIPFLVALLHNAPPVVELVERNPFPGTPPRYVRALLYEYHFTRRGEDGWWKRELLGLYCPAVSLREETK